MVKNQNGINRELISSKEKSSRMKHVHEVINNYIVNYIITIFLCYSCNRSE